jgi:hypothetical protein
VSGCDDSLVQFMRDYAPWLLLLSVMLIFAIEDGLRGRR